MSFDYFVAIHEGDWPASNAVQGALDRLGYPLQLVAASGALFDLRNGTLPVMFEGRSVEIEAEVEQAVDADNPESLFGYIAQAASATFSIRNGDYFLTLTFRSDADEIRAGLYLAAAMILSFNGYGFENQYESHGQSAFAEQMVREAADQSVWTD
jgi:hypothetical protein